MTGVSEGVDTRRYTGGLSESYEKLVWCSIWRILRV
jgi:hypothetical protein